MTSKGPFQSKAFYDSMILLSSAESELNRIFAGKEKAELNISSQAPDNEKSKFLALCEKDQIKITSQPARGKPGQCQAKQPQFPQPLLIRLLLQTLHQLRCPSLHTLQPLNVSLVVRGPKLNTVFKVRPHQ
ncbi:hypothetical protein QYF61_024256, partial [Mycteria americana]